MLHQATWDGAEAVSYGVDDPGSSDYFWFARAGQSMAFVWVVGETTPPPAATDTRVMTALVAGLQEPDSFQRDDDSVGGSESAAVPAVPDQEILQDDLAQALGSWDSGWERRGSNSSDGSPACLSWTSNSAYGGGFGGSLGSNGSDEVAWYADETTAATAVEDARSQLESCSPAYEVTTVGLQPQVVVASSQSGVVWIVRSGTNVGVVSIQGGHADPPAEVSAAVGAVIDRVLRTTSP